MQKYDEYIFAKTANHIQVQSVLPIILGFECLTRTKTAKSPNNQEYLRLQPR